MVIRTCENCRKFNGGWALLELLRLPGLYTLDTTCLSLWITTEYKIRTIETEFDNCTSLTCDYFLPIQKGDTNDTERSTEEIAKEPWMVRFSIEWGRILAIVRKDPRANFDFGKLLQKHIDEERL